MTMKTVIKSALAFSILWRASCAIVISAPGMGKGIFAPSVAQTQPQQPVSVRIRSTQEPDLNGVAQILAMALVDPYQEEGPLNFKVKMEMLKATAGYNTMLHSRLRAIHAGVSMADKFEHYLAESDNLRLIWSNDAFRNKIEKAARLSTEPHVWSRHNFAYAPNSSSWLQHKMFTAEDRISGEIVGFCEVAMLSDPTVLSNKDAMSAMPAVANLAVSPAFRRRGIASRLVASASRFVRQEWGYDKLSLYVEKENNPAFTMYSNLGFEVQAEVTSKNTPQWYMAMEIPERVGAAVPAF